MTTPFRSIEQILDQTPDLPSISAVALSVMREAESPTCSARSIAEHVGQDPALASRILRLANSAYYGLPRKISNIQEAVVVLGTRAVRHLAIVASTYTWLNRPVRGYGLGPRELWSHSFTVGVGAQLVGQKTDRADGDVAFTAGLLHNMGKVVLSSWLQDRFVPLLRATELETLPFDEIERRALGFDHAEAGARLAERWNLPEPIVEAIRYHHRADDSAHHREVVDCVHVADHFATALGLGAGPDATKYETSPAAFARLGIEDEHAREIMADLEESYRRYDQIFDSLDRPGMAAA